MADKKTSALTAVAAALDAQELPCNDAGTSKKVTLAQVKTALQAGGNIALTLAGLAGFKTVLTAYKTADETVNNTVVKQNDDHLTITLVTATKYRIELDMLFTDASALGAAGVAVGLGGTATYNTVALYGQVVGADSVIAIAGNGFLLSTSDSLTGSGDDRYAVSLRGAVDVNAGGTLIIKWAQQAAVVANLVALKGSILFATEI